jgi:glycerate 2-kinase
MSGMKADAVIIGGGAAGMMCSAVAAERGLDVILLEPNKVLGRKVRITGKGSGGRNQELALSGAMGIAGMKDVCLFSVGSDGTDGPTDAAGGIVTGETKGQLEALGISIPDVLKDNDSYNALKQIDGLIFTGPTGTNVNDLCCLLIK